MNLGQLIVPPPEQQKLWLPPGVESLAPADGSRVPPDKNVAINLVPGEVEWAGTPLLQEEQIRHGVIPEPEIALAESLGIPAEVGARLHGEVGAKGYSDTYWTHFDFRPDVARVIARIQKQFPWKTFINTYYYHPPVWRRIYEFVSYDVWGGGLNAKGKYVGYRGKNINLTVNATAVFNAIWNDPHLPNIAWIIFRGRMWDRWYGWGRAPAGPADSDPLHDEHIHVSYML